MLFLVFLCGGFPLASEALAQNEEDHLETKTLTLVQAAMCERIEDFTPHNQAVVFPTSLERVSCFTSFDPVPEKTFVHHNWYYKDKLSTRIKLLLQPPRWSTFSSIQLREADKGPWRIEITDEKGDIFRVLRFSITD